MVVVVVVVVGSSSTVAPRPRTSTWWRRPKRGPGLAREQELEQVAAGRPRAEAAWLGRALATRRGAAPSAQRGFPTTRRHTGRRVSCIRRCSRRVVTGLATQNSSAGGGGDAGLSRRGRGRRRRRRR